MQRTMWQMTMGQLGFIKEHDPDFDGKMMNSMIYESIMGAYDKLDSETKQVIDRQIALVRLKYPKASPAIVLEFFANVSEYMGVEE